MRVLYFSQYFPPEVGATQTRAYEMSRYLAERGHKVTVVTEVPNHPSGIIPPHYRGRIMERRTESGMDVMRLWVWTSPQKSFKSRMLFYLSYMGMAGLAGSLVKGNYDLIYATSPPLFVGAAGLAASLARGIPLVFEVRDLWPDSAVELGELNNSGAIWAADKLERLLYSRSRRIVAVTPGIQLRLRERGMPHQKVALIPNGANTDLFRRDESGAKQLRARLGLENKFVVLYAGIHGIAQGLETLLMAAERLKEQDDIVFLFVGEGPKKAGLLQQKINMDLHNVKFLPEVPSASMPAYLSAANCAIVPLRDEAVFRGALPSKMFEAWACGCPVILSVAGDARAVLEQAEGGIAVPPEDPAELAAAIEAMQADPNSAAHMGLRGRQFVTQHYTRQEQARKLERLLLEVVQESKAQ